MSAQPEERSVRSADGTQIGFVTVGTGPPLVLVHGGVNTSNAWLPVAMAMADRFTCHVIDRRGRGRSGDAGRHSLDLECEDIRAVLDFAGADAHLLGHSYGAICAIETARRFSVGRLVLYEPPLMLPPERALELIERFRDAVEKNQIDEALTLFLTGGPELSHAEVSALQKTPFWKEMAEVAPTLTREMEAIHRLGSELERYRDLSAPTLLLVGTASPEHLKAASSGLQETLPDARTVWLEGQAHVANLLAPDTVAREVTGFLLATS